MKQNTGNHRLQAYLEEHKLPLRVWLGPSASETCGELLRQELGPQVELHRAPPGPSDEALEGPAIMVLTSADIHGSQRSILRWLAREALPGRPVVYGGSRNKDTLLEAINRWRVFRLLPSQTPQKALAVAVSRAHEALSVQVAMERCIEDLRGQCRRLEGAIEELRATQGQLIRSERLATLATISESLTSRIHEQFNTLDALEQSVLRLEPGPELSEALQVTVEGIRSTATLLSEMFAFSGEKDGELELRREPLDLLVARAVAFLQHDPDLKQRIVDVQCDSGAMIEVDRYRMYLVLMNFLRNAIQATSPGDHIVVRAYRGEYDATVEVKDSGQGMDKRTLEQIYTPFFSTRGGDGAGLGLRLSKSVVERQGGKVQCISTPGEGTCFRIRIPLTE